MFPHILHFEKHGVLITSDNIQVRSKSELIIYEFLKSHDVDFLYEPAMEINGLTVYPDFKIYRKADGHIIVWEHFGMMGSAEYMHSSQKKLIEYAKAGFWPMHNLILTYDSGDGRIDMGELERILRMMVLI